MKPTSSHLQKTSQEYFSVVWTSLAVETRGGLSGMVYFQLTEEDRLAAMVVTRIHGRWQHCGLLKSPSGATIGCDNEELMMMMMTPRFSFSIIISVKNPIGPPALFIILNCFPSLIISNQLAWPVYLFTRCVFILVQYMSFPHSVVSPYTFSH